MSSLGLQFFYFVDILVPFHVIATWSQEQTTSEKLWKMIVSKNSLILHLHM